MKSARKKEEEWERSMKLSETMSNGWIREVIIALITGWAASLIRFQPTPDNAYYTNVANTEMQGG